MAGNKFLSEIMINECECWGRQLQQQQRQQPQRGVCVIICCMQGNEFATCCTAAAAAAANAALALCKRLRNERASVDTT